MIYSVHFWYRKRNSRKRSTKFEGLVFAKDKQRAEELIEDLISDYPVEIEAPMSIVGGYPEKSLAEIYAERPELIHITPEEGYIYQVYFHRKCLSDYSK